jgi:ring-1,2-phenylacetyl-CoA epoxidase subunit PaaD
VNRIETAVRDALAQVKDPEIPVCTITQLGLVERVDVSDDAVAVADAAPGHRVTVRFSMEIPWTTDRITDDGREALKTFGIAPPLLQIAVPCPLCGSRDTTLEAPFGPTPCRTIRYCNACRNPFEGFKPKKEH